MTDAGQKSAFLAKGFLSTDVDFWPKMTKMVILAKMVIFGHSFNGFFGQKSKMSKMTFLTF